MALRLADRWIWDSWYVWDGDVCHAFYLCASRGLVDPERRHRNTNIGHAISKDLVSWEVLPDALSPSDSPAFDSWTTWTGSTIKGPNGKWWMFYTGTSRETEGSVQTIGAAVSDDLIEWTKLPGPLTEADGEWYEKVDDKIWNDEAWRDPWVYFDESDDLWHMLVTARANQGDPAERGVIGHAVSDNLENWKVLQPLSKPGLGFGHLEVFQLEIVDGVPLLIFCCGPLEMGSAMKAKYGEIAATYSLVLSNGLNDPDFRKAVAFQQNLVYAGRLVEKQGEGWFLIGFVNEVEGKFVGELSDPIPVTADPVLGLIQRG